MQDIGRTYRKAGVVRGHLLNHDLGGFAVPENLYPISTKANADHSAQVEQKVKKLLSDQDQSSTPQIVSYTVEVEEIANPPEQVNFKCQWGLKGQPLLAPVSIPSRLASDSGGFHGQGAESAPDDWKHASSKKKGRGEENRLGESIDHYKHPSSGRIVDDNAALGGVTLEPMVVAYHSGGGMDPMAAEHMLHQTSALINTLHPVAQGSWPLPQQNAFNELLSVLGGGKSKDFRRQDVLKGLLDASAEVSPWDDTRKFIDWLWQLKTPISPATLETLLLQTLKELED